jgi:hypothetical protein
MKEKKEVNLVARLQGAELLAEMRAIHLSVVNQVAVNLGGLVG